MKQVQHRDDDDSFWSSSISGECDDDGDRAGEQQQRDPKSYMILSDWKYFPVKTVRR